MQTQLFKNVSNLSVEYTNPSLSDLLNPTKGSWGLSPSDSGLQTQLFKNVSNLSVEYTNPSLSDLLNPTKGVPEANAEQFTAKSDV